jgi:hypothetical protein
MSQGPAHLYLRLGHAGGRERLEGLEGPWEELTVGALVTGVEAHLHATHRLPLSAPGQHPPPPPLLRLVYAGRVISAPGMEEELLHVLGLQPGETVYATLSASPVTSPTETSAGNASALAAAGFGGGKGRREQQAFSPFGSVGDGRGVRAAGCVSGSLRHDMVARCAREPHACICSRSRPAHTHTPRMTQEPVSRASWTTR